MRKLIACLCIAFGICAVVSAAEPLAQYLSPYADAYLFFTNRNTQKKMDKGLWTTIQKDSQEAASALADDTGDDEGDDDDDPVSVLLEKLHDRDASVVLNLHALSLKEPKIVVKGVASISGNLPADLDSVSRSCPEFKKTKSGSYDAYQLVTPERLKITIITTDRNTLHFQIELNFESPSPFVPFRKYKDPVALPVEIKDQMFVLGCHPDRFSGGLESPEFDSLLSKMSDLFLSGEIDEKLLKLNSIVECKDEQAAGECFGKLDSMVRETPDEQSGLFGKFFSGFKYSLSGRKIHLDVNMKLEDMWTLFKSLSGGAIMMDPATTP